MATLVLTAVGTAIGGPIGGAIGAMLGQSVDGTLLFRPARREGPRLTELAVQTSSYGTQIPRLFGRMRVAGTVIWATDLREMRQRSGGKGQPETTTYSYSASFAVLLSARPIVGIGRIWADGKLLRGGAGDWKTRTGFRLYLGDEDQPIDPLIGSAEGATLTPAHRGSAYAVFEDLQLADFGNRIPSLTFEVIADAQAVPIAAIVGDVAPDVASETAGALDGFAAAGGSVRAVLETLGEAAGGWFGERGGVIRLHRGIGDAVAIPDSGMSAGGDQARRARSVAMAATVPQTLSVEHYDPARDYQRGVQRARRPGAGALTETVEMPAAMDAGAAQVMAERMLAMRELGRTTRSVALGFGGLAIEPGARVAVVGEGGAWRVVDVSVEEMVTRLSITPIDEAPAPSTGASSGRVLGAPDLTIGRTLIEVAEVPGLDDTVLAQPRVLVAATGTGAGWRQAGLSLSIDDGTSWIVAGVSAAPAIIGRIAGRLDRGQCHVLDLDAAVEIVLARGDMALADADPGAIDRGSNLALVGEELIQFARARPLGAGRWRLSGLLRGRRGTDGAAHDTGDRFVLIDRDTIRAIDLPVSVLGRTVRVVATGVGDDANGVETRLDVSGVSVRPPPPVHLRAERGADGSVLIRWIRQSRAGWRWIDGGDVPLAEEREAYRVTVMTPSGVREEECPTAETVLLADERGVGPITIAVCQRGVFGESRPATLVVPAQPPG